jgi:hypothetical protein
MKRREFCKGIALLPASGALVSIPRLADSATPGKAAQAGKAETWKIIRLSPARASGTGALPDYARRMVSSDMLGLAEGGKRDPDYKGESSANVEYDPSKPPHQMTLTQEEQDVLDGKKCEVLAKVMKTGVARGNAFGADKLVDLGGTPHSSMYFGPPYMTPLRYRTPRPRSASTVSRNYKCSTAARTVLACPDTSVTIRRKTQDHEEQDWRIYTLGIVFGAVRCRNLKSASSSPQANRRIWTWRQAIWYTPEEQLVKKPTHYGGLQQP